MHDNTVRPILDILLWTVTLTWKLIHVKSMMQCRQEGNLYIYVCVCVCVCVCVYTHTHTHIHIILYIYIHIHTHIYIYTHAHTHYCTLPHLKLRIKVPMEQYIQEGTTVQYLNEWKVNEFQSKGQEYVTDGIPKWNIHCIQEIQFLTCLNNEIWM